jgi:hypothetical protein
MRKIDRPKQLKKRKRKMWIGTKIGSEREKEEKENEKAKK